MIPEELQDVFVFLRSREVPNRQQAPEMIHPRPDEMAAQIRSVMQLMGGGHRFEIDAEHLTAAA